jgi:DNA-binding ferritin-like protein
MSRSQRVPAAKIIERPVLILEKQLMDTLELASHVYQARMRPNFEMLPKIRTLFDGMADELQTFCNLIRQRIESLNGDTRRTLETVQSSYRRLRLVESITLRDQLDTLLCGYARYARQTSEATTSLQRARDEESLSILNLIFRAVDRCLWFLETYLEGLALNTDISRLPDWRSATPLVPPETH